MIVTLRGWYSIELKFCGDDMMMMMMMMIQS